MEESTNYGVCRGYRGKAHIVRIGLLGLPGSYHLSLCWRELGGDFWSVVIAEELKDIEEYSRVDNLCKQCEASAKERVEGREFMKTMESL